MEDRLRNENVRRDRKMPEFELKVSPAEPCKIDYSKSIEELTAYYDDLAKKIAGGQPELANGEFMQLGYALDFLDMVKRIFNIDLDFEETAIPTLDQIMAALSQAILTKKIPPEAGGDIMKKAAGYLSVVIWKNIGGGFKYGYTGPNLTLKPEMNNETEVGFEARLLNDRINMDFSYFWRKCKYCREIN